MLEAVVSRPPLGHDIDYLFTVREKKRKLEDQLKVINEHQAEIELKVIERMREEGVTKATGSKATVSVDRKVRPHVVDWEEFCRYVRRNNLFQLFERRVAAAAWNEICEKRKTPVPGTEPFVKDALSLRVIS